MGRMLAWLHGAPLTCRPRRSTSARKSPAPCTPACPSAWTAWWCLRVRHTHEPTVSQHGPNSHAAPRGPQHHCRTQHAGATSADTNTGLPKCSWLQPKSMALSHGERRSAASELHKGFVCSSLKQKLAGLMSPAARQRQGLDLIEHSRGPTYPRQDRYLREKPVYLQNADTEYLLGSSCSPWMTHRLWHALIMCSTSRAMSARHFSLSGPYTCTQATANGAL